MRLRVAHKKILTWLACLAVVFGSLVPAISHALQASAADPWQDFCSASKPGLDAASTDKSAPGGLSMPHCPYCTLHALDLAPAPVSCGTVLIADLPIEPPALFLAAPRTLHAWASANPRAPPSHA